MADLEKFFTAVFAKIGIADSNSVSHQICDDCLNLEKKMPSPAPRQDIHSKLLHLAPSKDRKHVILVEEVWVGVDAEGDPWSDNMGGRYIDCTGKTFNEAAQFVADKFNEFFGEIFND